MVPALGGTIVARASGPGHSPRAIVRLSGPEACAALASLATDAGDPAVRGVRRIRMRVEVCGAPCECPALALVMPGPGSFTGEDCVELVVPGNPALVDAVMEALGRVPGVVAAAPGAFMARAHAAGRIALADAERIALEIGAAHARELEAARHVQDNPLVQAAHAASVELAELLARVEAGIDFTDAEDVVAIPREELQSRVMAVNGDISQWIEGSVPLESMRSMPVVALRGAPNAGKSSLFNALLGSARAVASPVAGTTRDAIAEEVVFHAVPGAAAERGVRALLIDTPGIEDPRSAIDALMQEQARMADHADVLLLCEPLAAIVAARGAAPAGTGGAEGHGAAWSGDASRSGASGGGVGDVRASRVIRVATRSDEVPDHARGAATGAVYTSAVTGEGIESLASEIAAMLASRESATGSSHRVGVLSRHRQAMGQAREWLARCEEATGEGLGPAIRRPELVADALRGALDAIGEVTGAVTPDDVLGLVFSRFCIGK
jgi:tRNA modification GTPase